MYQILRNGNLGGRTLLLNTDSSIDYTNSADPYSLTRTSSADAAELFILPAGVLGFNGATAILEVFASYLNSDGASRILQGLATINGTTVYNSNTGGMSVGTGGARRAILFRLALIRETATTGWLSLSMLLGNQGAPSGGGGGTAIGSLGGGVYTQAFLDSVTIAPDAAITLGLSATWELASTNLSIQPKLRVLRVG